MPHRRILLSLLLACLWVFPAPVFGAEDSALFSFAEALYQDADYYRAVTEFKRLLHLAPDSPHAAEAALRIGQCYLAGERWDAAAEALEAVSKEYPETSQALEASFLAAEIPYRQQSFALAGEKFRLLSEQAVDPQVRDQALYRLAWTQIEQTAFDQARSTLTEIASPQALALAEALASPRTEGRKSPALAGTLSGLLPGAGQLYTGHWRDAGLALALNAAFIAAAIEAFDNDSPVLGGILVFFELGWYGGNIVNAVNHAQRHNRNLEQQEIHQLKKRYGINLELRQEAALIGIHGNF